MEYKLKLHKVVPNFDLPSTEGRSIKLTDYKQKKNLLLFFYNSGQCLQCLERLRSFATNYGSFGEFNTEILSISSDPIEDSMILKEEYRLPFPLLRDETGFQMDKFTLVEEGNATPSIFITDKFGSLYGQWIISHEEGDLPDVKEYLKILEYIEVQCPECGIFPEEKRA